MSASPLTAPARFLDRLLDRLERAEALDRPAEAVAAALRPLVPAGPVEDLASGVPSAHPVHPPLTVLSAGSFVSASVLDALGEPEAARRLTGVGLATAAPTVLTGASDWLSTAQGERRVGLVHAAVNGAGLAMLAVGYVARRQGRGGAGWGAAGCAAVAAGGWLGGHLAYALGVGVDTTAFSHLPEEWTDVAAAADVRVGATTEGWADGVALVLTRTDGGIAALASRCTHRGGPLHDGEIIDGCVTCPWHGSRFRLDDGSVATGPAVRPAPRLEAREVGGRVQVRLPDQERALRLRPVGA